MVVRRLLATLVAASLLVSCSDDGPRADPPEPTAPATSATVEPSATVTPTGIPPLPEAAAGAGMAAARAFVTFYFDLLSHAMKTGETQPVREYSTRGCQSCHSIPRRIDAIYDKGWSLQTDGWVVEEMLPETTSSKDYSYLLRVREAARTLVDASGAAKESSRRRLTGMRIQLVRTAGTWSVSRLDFIQ